MLKIKLTEILRKHKAVIVRGEEVPKGYIAIAGAFFPQGEISIALPEHLIKNHKKIKELANQAEECLIRAMQERRER